MVQLEMLYTQLLDQLCFGLGEVSAHSYITPLLAHFGGRAGFYWTSELSTLKYIQVISKVLSLLFITLVEVSVIDTQLMVLVS